MGCGDKELDERCPDRANYTPKLKTVYEHDCDKCIYLGPYRGSCENGYNSIYDLYFADHGGFSSVMYSGVTVIARYGDGGPDYVSGLTLIDQHEGLKEAKHRAELLGLIK